MTVLLRGVDGEAYNIADTSSNITLRDLAQLIADYAGRKVVWERPNAVESAGYSRDTKALLDGEKLQELGWKPFYSIQTGIARTMDILQSTKEKKGEHIST